MCLSVTLDCISCSAMADWPRWIDDARVDSAAMLSAFEAFCAREPDRSREFQSLFVIVHRSTFAVPPAWTLPSRQCNASNCRRCEAGAGGYQFRWWHQSWEQDYERLSRPGAWKRNEPWWVDVESMCLFWSCSCKDRLWSSSMSLCVFSDRSDEILERHPRVVGSGRCVSFLTAAMEPSENRTKMKWLGQWDGTVYSERDCTAGLSMFLGNQTAWL